MGFKHLLYSAFYSYNVIHRVTALVASGMHYIVFIKTGNIVINEIGRIICTYLLAHSHTYFYIIVMHAWRIKLGILVSDKILILSLFVGCFYHKGPALSLGSIPSLTTTISEIGYLLLPNPYMAEIPLKRRKSSIQPTTTLHEFQLNNKNCKSVRCLTSRQIWVTQSSLLKWFLHREVEDVIK